MDIRFFRITGFSFFLLIIITIRGLESHFSNFVLRVSSNAMDTCFLNITCASFFLIIITIWDLKDSRTERL